MQITSKRKYICQIPLEAGLTEMTISEPFGKKPNTRYGLPIDKDRIKVIF